MAALEPADALRAAQSTVARETLPKRNAIVFGAVGKVGEALLNSVLASTRYERVYVLTRRELDSTISRLAPLMVPGEDLPDEGPCFASDVNADDVFCCLTASRTFYRRDDVYHRVLPHQVLPLGRAALAMGAKRLVLIKPSDAVSQMGGYGRYLSDNEELALVNLPFQTTIILRPQRDETLEITGNPAQRLAHWILSTLGSYMTPARLQPRRTTTIVNACLTALEHRGAGVHIISLDDLQSENA